MTAADLGAFAWGDCLALFLHFLTLSLLAVGGAITTVPEMHRFLVLASGGAIQRLDCAGAGRAGAESVVCLGARLERGR